MRPPWKSRRNIYLHIWMFRMLCAHFNANICINILYCMLRLLRLSGGTLSYSSSHRVAVVAAVCGCQAKRRCRLNILNQNYKTETQWICVKRVSTHIYTHKPLKTYPYPYRARYSLQIQYVQSPRIMCMEVSDCCKCIAAYERRRCAPTSKHKPIIVHSHMFSLIIIVIVIII